MKIFKIQSDSLHELDMDSLRHLDSEAEFITSSLCSGVSGVGELLQVVSIDSLSDSALRDLGGMLVIIGKLINETAINHLAIRSQNRA